MAVEDAAELWQRELTALEEIERENNLFVVSIAASPIRHGQYELRLSNGDRKYIDLFHENWTGLRPGQRWADLRKFEIKEAK